MEYTNFSLFPLERIARNWPGGFEGCFDDSKLPFEIVKDVYIENVSALIPDDEFDYLKSHLGSEIVKHLEKVSYAIVHRYPSFVVDANTGHYTLESELREQSTEIVQRVVACLRLIRPTSQHAQFMGGRIESDGMFRHFHFDAPFSFVKSVPNQQLFHIRTEDIEDLRVFAPLFLQAMEGNYWKFIMAVQMFQAGFFQHSYPKVRYFLWTAALEALYTSHTSAQHRGSLVAKERIKYLLDKDTLIYPPGELTQYDNDPKLTVGGVIDEIYCLRNHIAHGDRVPDYYATAVGRTRDDGSEVSRLDMLMEAISSIVRQSLLLILKKSLLQHFSDDKSSALFFHGHTKKILEGKKLPQYRCP